MGAADPDFDLSGESLRRLFDALRGAEGILAAVSGGPNSISLMHLLARWRAERPAPPVAVATVDHGLRPESAQEAAFVAAAADRLDFPHETLAWAGRKPQTGLQEAARRARYALLCAHARQLGASHLVTAHTRDDQAETVLMRMARGSGLSGIAGMRPVVRRAGLLHVRPFLGVPKASLTALCVAQNWAFVEDPSNYDDRFARVRWRKIMPVLEKEGLTPERLATLAGRAQRAEEALDAKAQEAFARADLGTAGQVLRLRAAVLAEEPFEIACRVLRLGLAPLKSAEEPGRLSRLESCTQRLREAIRAGATHRATLMGAVIRLDRKGEISFAHEPARRRGRREMVRDDAAAAPHSLGKAGGDA